MYQLKTSSYTNFKSAKKSKSKKILFYMKHPYEDKLRHRSILSCYRRMVILILILILSILTSSGYSKLKPTKKAKESFVT